jgi:two-component system sensor histidine kinase YesM
VLIGGFLLVLLPFAAIGLWANYLAMREAEERVVSTYRESLLLFRNQVNAQIDQLERLALSFLVDADLNALHQSPPGDTGVWQYALAAERLKLEADNTILHADVALCLPNKNRVLSSMNGISTIDETPEYRECLNSDYRAGQWAFVPDPREAGETTLSLKLVGPMQLVALITIHEPSMRNALSAFGSSERLIPLLLGESGEAILPVTVSQTDPSVLRTALTGRALPTEPRPVSFDDAPYTWMSLPLRSGGVHVGLLFSSDDLRLVSQRYRALLAVLLASTIILSALYIRFSFKRLLDPIHNLARAMQEVESGNLGVRLEHGPDKELGFVTDRFNDMSARLEELVNEVYHRRVLWQKAQLRFLQSQINPHFLSNCLNLLYSMSMADDSEAAADLSLYLGRYFRFMTRANRDSVSLNEELKVVGDYIAIQKIRMPDRFSFEMMVQESVRSVEIPSLTIQPLVENAVVHGIERCERPCAVRLRAWREDGQLNVSVFDDGQGAESAVIKEIRERLRTRETESDHVGLYNVNWRLKLKYGDKATMDIEPVSPAGTIVTLSIPLDNEVE